MTERRIVRLAGPLQRQTAAAYLRNAPDGYIVTIKPPTRSLDMNAKFHAICADIERSKFVWSRKPRSAAEWKVLLVSGHAVASQEPCEVVAGLEGELVSIRESTAAMSVKRGSSLIEYALAFCAENGIWLSTDERQEVHA